MQNIPASAKDSPAVIMPVAMPAPRTTTRKIGGTTFVVSSSFSSTGKGDVVSKIVRLIRADAEKSS